MTHYVPREAAWSTLRRSGTFAGPQEKAAVSPARPYYEIVAWCAVAVLLVTTVLRISGVELPIFRWGKPDVPQFELSAKQELQGIRLEWKAPPQSSGGILRATDAGGQRTIPLSASAVQAGALDYGRVRGTAKFVLAIQVGSSGWQSEELAYLGPAGK